MDTLRDLRLERQMSLGDVAQQMRCSRQAVSLWETGTTQPSIGHLRKLAEVLAVDLPVVQTALGLSQQHPTRAHIRNHKVRVFQQLNLGERQLLAANARWERLMAESDGAAISLNQQRRRCNRVTCTRCTHGPAHGPYWYAYWLDQQTGRRRSAYIGKVRPDVAA